jgi:hypothetical protein
MIEATLVPPEQPAPVVDGGNGSAMRRVIAAGGQRCAQSVSNNRKPGKLIAGLLVRVQPEA